MSLESVLKILGENIEKFFENDIGTTIKTYFNKEWLMGLKKNKNE